ncbi:MAG: hypothetical protein ACW98X_27625 [Promethearchaeota archaeon]|jgi:SAM-dependent methyltransferase
MKLINPLIEPEYNYAYPRRFRQTTDFIKKNGIKGPVLVTGKKNEFEEMLKNYYDLRFVYTSFNLNYPFPIQSKCNTILSFQVIEHLLNPLLFLIEINKVLSDNGLLYISYPIHGSKMFWSSGHFHEYDKSRFRYLLTQSGFSCVDYTEHIIWRRIRGIRSIIRNTPLGWCKHQYYALRKV